MELKEMRALSVEELNAKIKEGRQELFNLRFQLATRQLTNTSQAKRVKHRIAQLETVLREKQPAEKGR